MFRGLKIYIKKLLQTGLQKAPDASYNKYIQRTNYVTFNILCLIIPYGTLFYVVGGKLQALLLAVAWFLFTLVFYFNRRGWFVKAKLWLQKMILVCLIYFGLVFGHESGVQYLFFVFITLPFLLFPFREYLWLSISILAFILGFYTLEYSWITLPVVIDSGAQNVLNAAIIILVFLWISGNYLYNDYLTRMAEARLRKNNKRLEEKNKELEQFAYIASHDLQEPLLTITNFTTLMKEELEPKLEESERHYVRFISEAATRMQRLVKGLMDYSRLGKQKELTTLDCNTVVREVIADLTHSVEKHKATIIINPLPVISGYETELHLLFQNLIGNALKFSKPGVPPQVDISANRANEDWKFEVKDNGIGIKEQYLEKIFVIFQRLHNRHEYEGTGIGLAHCRKIIELHGGNIWAESTPGEGTVFYFTIPAAN